MILTLPPELFLPVSLAMGLVSFTLIAHWYVEPWLDARPVEAALKPLLLLHTFRFIGLAFLIDGVTAAALDPRFAIPAAYGDLLAALLALLALFAVTRQWRSAAVLVLVFNVFGALDLFNAVIQGLRYTEHAQLGATWFIPTVIVPVLFVSHYLIVKLQLRERRERRSDSRGDQPSRVVTVTNAVTDRGGVQ